MTEQEYWRQVVDELNERFTLQFIADQIHVTLRQVTNIKNGDRPKGLVAVRLYMFHMERRTRVPFSGTVVPSISAQCESP